MKFVECIQTALLVEPSFERTFMTPNFALSHEVKSDGPLQPSVGCKQTVNAE